MAAVEEIGVAYDPREWPHGLACIDCHHVLRVGDRYVERLYAFTGDAPIVEIVCSGCATAEASARPEPPA